MPQRVCVISPFVQSTRNRVCVAGTFVSTPREGRGRGSHVEVSEPGREPATARVVLNFVSENKWSMILHLCGQCMRERARDGGREMAGERTRQTDRRTERLSKSNPVNHKGSLQDGQ